MDAQTYPQVFDYLNANQFLQDVYTYLKTHSPKNDKFTFESWAAQMDVKSRSHLRFVVLGKRGISPELTQKLSDFLKLNSTERTYFSLLILYTQTRQKEQKAILGRQLTQLLRKEQSHTEVPATASILADPSALAVRNSLSFTDIPKTSEDLQKLFGFSTKTLLDILERLEQEKLIVREGADWKATHSDVKVSDKTLGETLAYHKQTLLMAIKAQSLPVHERHFRSIGIALSQEEYKTYLEHLDQFIKTVFSNFNGESLHQKRLYQINFNLFPWTQTMVTSRDHQDP